MTGLLGAGVDTRTEEQALELALAEYRAALANWSRRDVGCSRADDQFDVHVTCHDGRDSAFAARWCAQRAGWERVDLVEGVFCLVWTAHFARPC